MKCSPCLGHFNATELLAPYSQTTYLHGQHQSQTWPHFGPWWIYFGADSDHLQLSLPLPKTSSQFAPENRPKLPEKEAGSSSKRIHFQGRTCYIVSESVHHKSFSQLAPANWWLEDYKHIGKGTFSGAMFNFGRVTSRNPWIQPWMVVVPQLHARVSAYHHHLTMDLLEETGRPEREPQNTEKLEETWRNHSI